MDKEKTHQNNTKVLFGIDGNEKQEAFSKKLIQLSLNEFKNGNLHLFDGINGTNQCHINALAICNMFNQGKHLSDKFPISSETKCLTLNFFLSSVWVQGRSLLKNKLNSEFIFDKTMIVKAKKQLKKMQESNIDDLLQSCKSSNSMNNNTLNEIEHFRCSEKVDQFPKFLGIELVLHAAKKNNIPFLVKKKCIDKDSTQTTCNMFHWSNNNWNSVSLLDIDKKKPVIVIDGVCCKLSKKKVKDLVFRRRNCFHNLFNNVRKTHSIEDSCHLCNNLNTLPICSEWECPLPFAETQLAVAAEFTKNRQTDSWNRVIEQKKRFPTLADGLKDFQALAQNNDMWNNNISEFWIEHMYPSTFEKALQTKRLVDCRPQELLNE